MVKYLLKKLGRWFSSARVGLVALPLVSLMIWGTGSLVFLQAEDSLLREARLRGEIIAQNLSRSVLRVPPVSAIDSFRERYGLLYALYFDDKDGLLLPKVLSEIEKTYLKPGGIRVISRTPVAEVRSFLSVQNEEIIDIRAPVRKDGKRVGSIRIGFSSSPLRRPFEEWEFYLGIASLSVFVLGLIYLIFIGRMPHTVKFIPVLILLVGLGAGVGYLSANLNFLLEDGARLWGEAISDGLAEVARSAEGEILRLNLEEHIKEILDRYKEVSYAFILDGDNNILVHSDPSVVRGRNYAFIKPSELKSLAGEPILVQRYIGDEGEPMIDIAIPVIEGGSRIGSAHLGVSLYKIVAFEELLRNEMIAGSLLVFLVIAAAAIVAGRVSLVVKFGLSIVVLVIAIMGTVSFLVLRHERGALEAEIVKRGVVIAKGLAASSADDLLDGDYIRLGSWVRDVKRENKEVVYSFVLDRDDVMRAHTDRDLVNEVYEPPEGVVPFSFPRYGVQSYVWNGRRVLNVTELALSGGSLLGRVHVGLYERGFIDFPPTRKGGYRSFSFYAASAAILVFFSLILFAKFFSRWWARFLALALVVLGGGGGLYAFSLLRGWEDVPARAAVLVVGSALSIYGLIAGIVRDWRRWPRVVFTASLFVFLASANAFFDYRDWRSSVSELEAGGKSIAGAIVRNLPGNWEDEEAVAGAISRSVRGVDDLAYIWVVDGEGVVRGALQRGLVGRPFERPKGLSVPAPADFLAQAYRTPEGESLLDIAVPIRIGRAQIGLAKVGISRDSIDRAMRGAVNGILRIAIGMMTLGVVGASLLAMVVVRPINVLAEGANRIGREGDLDYKIVVRSRDEIGDLADNFNRMTDNLKRLQKELLRAQEREINIRRDLEVARQVQQTLLPRELPQIPGLSIGAVYRSAQEVGGDYYDFIPVSDHELGIVVADVSNKGVQAALVMAMAKSVLKTLAVGDSNAASVLKRTNAMIYDDLKRGMFITAFYVVLNTKNFKINFASAGHNPMVLLNAKERKIELINPKGIAMGLVKPGMFDPTIKVNALQLERGDMIIQYTDGVTEAMNSKNEEFGEERLNSLVKRYALKASGEEMVGIIDRAIQKFAGRAPQSDDITIVAIRVTG
ncbi:MAG: SpoIIE family protein phosphatase [bacterium]